MDEAHQRLIAAQLLDATGVAVTVSAPRIVGERVSLVAYISGLSSQAGPRLTIAPHGLKRHRVTLQMGTFSMPCIRQMAAASPEKYALARELVRHLALPPDTTVTVGPRQSIDSWTVTAADFQIEVITRTAGDQYDDTEFATTARNVMAPLLAAMAELMGREDFISTDGDALGGEVEGEEKKYFITRRERSRRNRLLCLSIHGHRCAACQNDPTEYFTSISSIVEVHHIEPIATLTSPRPYNPATDLVPLCPNCHRMVHTREPALSVAELRTIIEGAR